MDDNAKKCDQCGAPVRIRPNQAGGREKKGKKAGSRKEKSLLSVGEEAGKAPQEEESFMDPVFFEEPGKGVDVDAIIKIARGEEPEDAKAPEAEKAPENTESLSAEPVSDEPVPGEEEAEEEEPELDMESYLAGLPLIEKIRRKMLMRHHKREEASDERRMKMHLERASRHYSEKENTGLKSGGLRLEGVRSEEKASAAAHPQEEKGRVQKAEPERPARETLVQEQKHRTEGTEPERPVQETSVREEKAQPVKAEEENVDAVRLEEEKLLAKIEEEKRLEALRLQEEAARRAEEEARAERIAAAARQKERARAGAARRQKEQQEQQAEIPAPQKREGLEVIRLHGRKKAGKAAVPEEEAAAEAALVQEADPAAEAALVQEADLAAEAARLQDEKKANGTGEAGDHISARPVYSELQQEEKIRLQKILNTGRQEYDSYRRLDSRDQRELTAQERKLEQLRRMRKIRSNQQDQFDKYLGKYGLTKETAVRIATLFLIVLLSLIYVLGRGGSNTSPDLSNAGDGMTGIESAQEQTGGEVQTDSAQEPGESQVPTGGGDFGNN